MNSFSATLLKRYYIPVLLIVGILVFAFWGGLSDMFHKWSTQEEYGYAYFLPFITVFLIYQKKQALLSLKFKPSWVGVFVMLLAVIAFFLGEIATTYTLVQYSLVLLLFGFAWALLGWQAFSWIRGPIALLFFMVPFPPFILNTLSGYLQLISSEIGVSVIRAFGISVFLEGNVIDLGNYQLQVVEACSGLNYLFPLVSLSFIMVYLYKVEAWKRALIFFSSIPITVLMNSFRIGVIGWLVDNWGIEQAEGFLHYFEGWVIFISCLAIILLEMSWLSRVGKALPLGQVFNLQWPDKLPEGFKSPERSMTSVHYGMVAVFALLLLSRLYVKGLEEIQPDRIGFSQFPQQVGHWIGQDEKIEDNILGSLKLDDYYLADYEDQSGNWINFYVAYYASQQAGSAAHSPRACIPGGGWKIATVTTVNVPGVDVQGTPLKVNRLVIKRGDFKQVVYYWFQQRGRVITNEYLVKWYLFLDGLTRQRTDGALVRLSTVVQSTEDWSDADARLVSFAGKVAPLLKDYVPQ